MAKQGQYYNPSVTTGGSYVNPRLGITSYLGFMKGVEEGLKPGEEMIKEFELEYDARVKKAGEVEDIIGAGGEYFDGGAFDPNVDLTEMYTNVVQNYRDVLLDKGSTAKERREAENAVNQLKTGNDSLTYLLTVDDDRTVYSEKASDIDDLFVDQGTSLNEFRNLYSNGGLVAERGGFRYTKGENKGLFVDFQNKINKNTIDAKMNLRSDEKVNTEATGFSDSLATLIGATDQNFWLTDKATKLVGELKVMKDKSGATSSVYTKKLEEIRSLHQDYINNVENQSQNAASQFIANDPHYLPSIIQDMQNGNFLTDGERGILDKIVSREGKYNENLINVGFGVQPSPGMDKVAVGYDEGEIFPRGFVTTDMQEALEVMKNTDRGSYDIMMKGADLLHAERFAKNKNYTIEDARREVASAHDKFKKDLATSYVANEMRKKVDGYIVDENGMAVAQEPNTITAEEDVVGVSLSRPGTTNVNIQLNDTNDPNIPSPNLLTNIFGVTSPDSGEFFNILGDDSDKTKEILKTNIGDGEYYEYKGINLEDPNTVKGLSKAFNQMFGSMSGALLNAQDARNSFNAAFLADDAWNTTGANSVAELTDDQRSQLDRKWNSQISTRPDARLIYIDYEHNKRVVPLNNIQTGDGYYKDVVDFYTEALPGGTTTNTAKYKTAISNQYKNSWMKVRDDRVRTNVEFQHPIRKATEKDVKLNSKLKIGQKFRPPAEFKDLTKMVEFFTVNGKLNKISFENELRSVNNLRRRKGLSVIGLPADWDDE